MKRRGKRIRRFLTGVFLSADIVSLLLLWACCLLTWVPPYFCPRLAVACLTFPIILLFNLLWLPFWLLFKPKYALVPLIGILLTGGFILDYFPLHRSPTQADADLTILSWNVMNFTYKDIKERQEELFAYIDSVDADIICLQECAGGKIAADLKERLLEQGYEHHETNGRTIYSRFPILSHDTLSAKTSLNNGVNVYELLRGEDTLVVMNTHLESNFLSTEDKYDGKAALKSRDRNELKQEGKRLWGKLANSQSNRGRQTDTLTAALDTHFARASVIVCGDFNDTPISYACQQLSRRLENAYRNKGFGIGVSYNEHLFLFRIDHLFHSNDWQTLSARVDNSSLLSDHYPLIVKLRRKY
ncbi:MAG: endonuclease/exonuclease/phosphatase family protein [Prevotellaceae bacterium]|nr:endonuclease/exonuclease/phosphatase family protein [Prevotellaceae bacterium]